MVLIKYARSLIFDWSINFLRKFCVHVGEIQCAGESNFCDNKLVYTIEAYIFLFIEMAEGMHACNLYNVL